MEKGIAIPDDIIVSKIYLIRGLKVMLDSDLSELYNVETKRLNEQVKRNPERFPDDFMFQLTEEEFKNLKSQNATSSWGGRRNLPFAFTEYGVLMLSGVLNSQTAIQVNIHIMRVYTKLREMLLTHKDLLLKMEQYEQQAIQNSDDIRLIFSTLQKLLNPGIPPRRQIGFKTKDKD
jgi:ORF6N domain-containing protein